ncbi:hypothetical protein BGI37_02030 [Snodgrassella alvi]|nr:hypothetical protein BGI37_02030 [Snodgrassella alvi]
MELKKLLAIFLVVFPIVCLAKAPDCYNWPMNMTKGWLKNTNITNIYNLDESKTKITLLASEKKQNGLHTQVYHFVFYDKKGKSCEIITKNETLYDECSTSQVNSYLITKKDINY